MKDMFLLFAHYYSSIRTICAFILIAVTVVAVMAAVKPAIAAEHGKILVVYFSGSGNTRSVANDIAELTGADVFELKPTQPYSEEDLDYMDRDSRCVKERNDPKLQHVELVASTVSNWSEYDTVFIGYPIWWGVAAWPVNTFIEANDFTGKRVIPFCTHGGSGLGSSGERLAKAAATGEWQKGRGFRNRFSKSDISSWLKDIGLIAE